MKSYVALVCLAALAACFVVQTEGSLFPHTYYLIQKLLWQIKEVKSRGCETGSFNADVCDPLGISDPLCIYGVLLRNELTEVAVDINFEKPFKKPPAMLAAISGVFSSTDKNCTVEAINVREEGFTLKFTLGGILPFTLKSSWMACDARHH